MKMRRNDIYYISLLTIILITFIGMVALLFLCYRFTIYVALGNPENIRPLRALTMLFIATSGLSIWIGTILKSTIQSINECMNYFKKRKVKSCKEKI